MAAARFSIGIDLGTTNSAMAYVSLEGNSPTEAFVVSQWETATNVVDDKIVPSFSYLPEGGADATVQGGVKEGGEWIVGRLARRKAGEAPDRVAHSAKSWLCHHAADRTEKFLPWGSSSIPRESKLSPIRASALILNFLREAWNTHYASAGADFDSQEITVTVPASFDAAAQKLTLLAAEEAGYPNTVRLLEEPQAAFTRWLEQRQSVKLLREHFPDRDTVRVLVVDVGGGTSDFSTFDISMRAAGSFPPIERTAVSDHILLGGDNIDLALAHLVETRLTDAAGTLAPAQWEHLVSRCRDAKEKALGTEGEASDLFSIAIPGRGSSLMASAVSAQLSRSEIEAILFEGFFPYCARDDKPKRGKSGLKEWGLPYAADSAVTRHLAAFLDGRERVDAVLFNGGSLFPLRLRHRIRDVIAQWQGEPTPLILDNAEPDLAVARGAALSGKLQYLKSAWIEAGAARAIFVEAHRRRDTVADAGSAPPQLVCVLPRGASPEDTFELDDLGLELRLNKPVRFQPYSSTRHRRSRAGDILELDPDAFQPLPPLETIATVPEDAGSASGETVRIGLTAKVNELGLLQVLCRSNDPAIAKTWPLEFNLRQTEGPRDAADREPDVPLVTEPNVPLEAIAAAQQELEAALSKPLGQKEKLNTTRTLKRLEGKLGLPKHEWNWVVVRSFWPTLELCMGQRSRSIEHEETWLNLAGFVLRPGFGAPLDPARMDGLWKLREAGLYHPGKRIQAQEHILWRRVAGGLDRERQDRLLAKEINRLTSSPSPPPELVRLAGSLERLGHELKARLIERFIDSVAKSARTGKHCAPQIAALEGLLNRSPFYAGPEAVVSPVFVERAFDAFADLDWTDPELVDLQSLFLRAARVVDNRALDVSKEVRGRIAAKLERSGVPTQRTAKLKQFAPLEGLERASLYGETLPPGLVLSAE